MYMNRSSSDSSMVDENLRRWEAVRPQSPVQIPLWSMKTEITNDRTFLPARVQIPLWSMKTGTKSLRPGSKKVQIPLWSMKTINSKSLPISLRGSDSSMVDENVVLWPHKGACCSVQIPLWSMKTSGI